VLANGIRALGIVLLGHHLGSAEAAAADHLIYGWVFFSVIILLLVLAGLPFREDRPESAPLFLPPPTRWHRGALAGATALTLAAGLATPALAAVLDRAPPGTPERVTVALAPAEGCAAEGPALRCGGLTLAAHLLRFPHGTRWSDLVAERLRISGHEDEAVTFSVSAEGARWEARQAPGQADGTAVAAWHGGAPAGDGLRARATRLWQELRGAEGRPVLAIIVVEAPGAGQRQARALLRRLLEQGAAAGVVDAARAQSLGG
jgi:hypothetical protein